MSEIDENTLDKFKEEMARNEEFRKESDKIASDSYRDWEKKKIHKIFFRRKVSKYIYRALDTLMYIAIGNLFLTYLFDGIINPDMTYGENFMRTFKHILWNFSR